MKRYDLKKKVTMIIFLLFIGSFSLMNMRYAIPSFRIIDSLSIKENIVQTEAVMNDQVYLKYAFIEGYGYVQNVLYKNEANAFEVIKDKDDVLYLEKFEQAPRDMEEVAQRTIKMNEYLKNHDTNFMTIIMPDKYIRGKTTITEGYPYNYANETLDAYQERLLEHHVSTYDIRPLLETSTLTQDELFFKTDHHWRIETAFLAYQEFLDVFQHQYNVDLDPTGFYRNPDHYNFLTYPSLFLGSLGRKTGSSYAGSDDFTYIYPKYDTNFQMTWTLQDSTFTKTGRFEVALTNPSYLHHRGVFDAKSDTYSMYLDGNAAFTSISNLKDTNQIKVLFIKDSYALPFVAFFANHVKQVDLIDPRYFEGDLTEFMKQADYDYVFSALGVSTLQTQYLPDFISKH